MEALSCQQLPDKRIGFIDIFFIRSGFGSRLTTKLFCEKSLEVRPSPAPISRIFNPSVDKFHLI